MGQILVVDTRGPGLVEITQPVRAAIRGHAGTLVTVFVRHTSASLLIQENADPTARADLERFFERLIPPADDPSQAWMTHVLEGPDDMPAHLRAAILPVSVSIPIIDGTLALGTWQGIYLFEHRRRPHRREVAIQISG